MKSTAREKIALAIAKLQGLTQLDIQSRWLYREEINRTVSIDNYLQKIQLASCQTASLNEKKYLVFKRGRKIRWLLQKIIIPDRLQGYKVADLTLRLVLTWWAEDAQIFINGQLVQQGDLFDSSARILITNNSVVGSEFLIAIRLVSPFHDIGALMRSHLLFEQKNVPVAIDPGWFGKEIAVLNKYLENFEPQQLNILARELSVIDWSLVAEREQFDSCLKRVRENILPLAQNIKQRKFNLLGHAHLDLAWLWTTAETYEVAKRTFSSVLNLQKESPQLTFCHTSPALYQWIEKNCPDLFLEIQKAIENNRWEALGGMWIEPEVNLVNGESIIRQLLYGQQYYQEKFDRLTRVAWLPDSFGFPWQLPQLLKQCGIDYFVTGKLHWNDTTKFPHGCFWWESPDGTRLFTLMSPPNVTGVMDTNPITMANYAVEWESQTGLQDIFWLPGVGDHGGGPTRDMLEVASKWQQSPFFPELEFTTATAYLDKVSGYAELGEEETERGRDLGTGGNNKLSTNNSEASHLQRAKRTINNIHNSELYLELHRGCYTTHGDQKRFNRYCENLLYQAELFATLAISIRENSLVCPLFSDYVQNIRQKQESQTKINPKNTSNLSWQEDIKTAWKKVLFNQFHDILPGTSITEVFVEANREWQQAIAIGEKVLQQSLKAIADLINLPNPPHPDAKPIVVFNALNWMRSQIVTISLEQEYRQVCDLKYNPITSQVTPDNKLQFLARDIPSVGYKVYWLSKAELVAEEFTDNSHYILENQYLKVIINSRTGDIDSLYDKENNREVLSGSGNQLQAFSDKGQYWDAWNIDPEYEQKQLPAASLKSIQWLEFSLIKQTIRVIKIIGNSEFIQDYILEKYSPILKIANTVDWQETHILVKAAFPLTISSDYATSEIACGAIKRPTKLETEAEKAKWETSALKWVDLTDEKQNYGVSLLNDCKYGYDTKPEQIRITLLRSPVWPDPKSDRGKHHFTYAIYPHKNSWQQAKTVRHSYELNMPLQVIKINPNSSGNKFLNSIASFVDLSAKNLILTAFKLPENQEDSGLILHCYECHGKTASLNLKGDLQLTIDREINCLEEDIDRKVNNVVEPWKVKNYKLSSSSINKI